MSFISPDIISIKNLNQSFEDIDDLIRVRDFVVSRQFVIFDFSKCGFLGPTAVAVLGAIFFEMRARGLKFYINWASMNKKVLANLCQNGFAKSHNYQHSPWEGNSVPYRQDVGNDYNDILSHLTEKWLNRDWINFSDKLRFAIAGRVWEMYANAFEHSGSESGVFSCGQHFHTKKDLVLSVVDFGFGIPCKIRNFLMQEGVCDLSDADCLKWAFESGNTTEVKAGIPRGLGLDLLREFVYLNNGALEIFSGHAYVVVDGNGLFFRNRERSFRGTLVQLKIICDDRIYKFKSEL